MVASEKAGTAAELGDVEIRRRRKPGSEHSLPEKLDDYITDDNPVRVIDVYVDELDLRRLGFDTKPAETGRPGYHPATLLKIYIYGYLNRIQSSRRLERETQRNVEVMWLSGGSVPTSRPSPISVATMGSRSRKRAASSS